MAKRESKSPFRSLLRIFSNPDDGNYTKAHLGDEKKKFFYDPVKKKFIIDGQPETDETPPPPPGRATNNPAKQDPLPAPQSNQLTSASSMQAPPGNSSLQTIKARRNQDGRHAQQPTQQPLRPPQVADPQPQSKSPVPPSQ